MIGNNSCGSHSVAWGTTLENVGRAGRPALRRHAADRRAATASTATPPRAAALRDLADEQPRAAAHRARPARPAGVRLPAAPAAARARPRRREGAGRHRGHVRGGARRDGPAGARCRATRALLVLGFADDVAAADAVPAILPHRPLTVESMDERILALRDARSAEPRPALPTGGAWLFVEVGGATRRRPRQRPPRSPAQLSVPHEVLHRARRAARAVAAARGGLGHLDAHGGRLGGVARLGGHGRSAGTARRVPAGVPRAAGRGTGCAG